MKVLFLFLFGITGFCATAMPTDTITVWHLYFNGEKHLDLFPYGFYPEIKLSKDTLTNESTFSIRHAAGCLWNDDNWVNFAIVDQNEHLVDRVSGVYSKKELTLSLTKLLAYHKQSGEKTFDLYYSLGDDATIELAHHMVRITLID